MMTKGEAVIVRDLCKEVAALAKAVVTEIDQQPGYADGKWTERKYKTSAPSEAYYYGPSITAAALRRRSMDLTRALAQLRKA